MHQRRSSAVRCGRTRCFAGLRAVLEVGALRLAAMGNDSAAGRVLLPGQPRRFRAMRKSLLALAVGGAAVAAVASLGVAWEAKADKVCRAKAPASANGYSVRWEWDELAYVCDYRAPAAKER